MVIVDYKSTTLWSKIENLDQRVIVSFLIIKVCQLPTADYRLKTADYQLSEGTEGKGTYIKQKSVWESEIGIIQIFKNLMVGSSNYKMVLLIIRKAFNIYNIIWLGNWVKNINLSLVCI